MLLTIGWIFLGAESLAAIGFGLVLWRFWDHSGIDRAVTVRAAVVYAVGCILCILLALAIPL